MRFLRLLVLCLAAMSLVSHARAGKLVFAHYMVCCSLTAPNPTVADLQSEIETAQSYGIDGFILNCGAWRREPYYEIVSRRMFEAARRYQGRFWLFFSADPSTGLTPAEAVDMVVKFRGEPAYFFYDNRPVLTTFHGTREWVQSIRGNLQSIGSPVFFVPNVSTLKQRPLPGFEIETPTEAVAAELLREDEDVDGHSYFGAGGTYEDISKSIMYFGAAAAENRKLFMAPVTPYYRGLNANYRVFESDGYLGMASEWIAAIRSDAEWVQIVTWNDWSEDTYVQPFQGADFRMFNKRWGLMLAHDGFLQASAYYIKWFKNGMAPQVENNLICFFYRPQVVTSSDVLRPKGFQALKDRMFVFSAIKAKMRFELRGPVEARSISLLPGVGFDSLPLFPGPADVLVTDGSLTGGRSILSVHTEPFGNFNYYASCLRDLP